METEPQSPEMIVQRLRYQFRMSGDLKNVIRSLFIPQAPRTEVFFYSTFHVLTDELWSYDAHEPLRRAKAYIENEEIQPPLLLKAEQPAGITMLKGGLARIALRPADQEGFDALIAPLAKVSSISPQAPIGHYYYAVVPERYVNPDTEKREERLAFLQNQVKNPAATHYYTMRRLTIAEDSVRIARPQQAA